MYYVSCPQYTTAQYNQEVSSRKQATFEYGFTPNEGFAGRPFGLSILLNYKDEVTINMY